ncbi:SRPBCC domain-containing protein [Bdellovibrio sp. HCB2-146]|uniref:SRPBCC domain-containing protein n=1 Tax=Bdellovibrio sp. HCB2-146 TaxID=3394362 RepID=UPI0039BC311C
MAKKAVSKKKSEPKITKIGRVSAESVVKGTGRNWDEWIAILDKNGARNQTHQEIVAFLAKKYKLTAWWQQGVTTAYEIHIQRRAEGRNTKGEYMLTSTKTLKCDAKKLWKFLVSNEGVAIWLKPLSPVKIKPGEPFETETGAYGEIRTMKAPDRIRMTWQEPEWTKKSVLQVWVVGRANGKSILVFNHEQLRDGRLRHQLKEHWMDVLVAVKEQVE